MQRPVVMTIVNVTPDSFFAGSRSMHIEEIAMRVEEAVGWGAKIIDVGERQLFRSSNTVRRIRNGAANRRTPCGVKRSRDQSGGDYHGYLSD